MAIEVFNRYENKYLMDLETMRILQARILEYMDPDAHCVSGRTYPIISLYYDTPDCALIRASLSKPQYKEKLRLRAYGGADERVYVECKKKVRGLVNKRRSAMELEAAYRFLATSEPPAPKDGDGINHQVLREIQAMLERYPLRPAALIRYDRCAYSAEASGLRVSFDTNIRARREELRVESGAIPALDTPVIADTLSLMEIKTPRNIPVWLVRLLSENCVYPTSFSKYGTVYRQALAGARTREQAAKRHSAVRVGELSLA